MTIERVGVHNTEMIAGNNQPQIEVPRDKKGRIRWSVLEESERAIFIRQEAQALLLNGGVLTRKTAPLVMSGAERFYPGGVNGLRVDLGQPVLKRRNGYWNPETTEVEAQRFFEEHNDFSLPLLAKNKENSLAVAVNKYPGGLAALREKLDLEPKRKPNSYWTPENIEAEARQFMDQGQSFTTSTLKQEGRNDLLIAVTRKYPGGIRGLQEKLGTPVRRTLSYWEDPANIEAEARAVYDRAGGLTQASAKGIKNLGMLWEAIRRYYPGGLEELRVNLEVASSGVKPHGYWTEQQIEQETLEFYQAEGALSGKLLRSRDRGDLKSAIDENYDGGMIALKQKLGIKITKKPSTYWTETQIETDTLAFFETEGILTQKTLIDKKRFDLIIAITRKYPGGIRVLREKLGIIDSTQQLQYITPQEANTQLRRLLEG